MKKIVSFILTLAMLVVILHRLEGEPAANAKASFTDLKQKWYAAAAHWAYESGVVKGGASTPRSNASCLTPRL